MNKPFLILALGAAFASSAAFAQTSAPMAASATSSAAVTATCKDGTAYSGATLKGACRGHGGVDKKASKMGSTAAPASSAAAAAPMAKPAAGASASASASTSATAPAAGGGAGKVWVNTSTKVYHCSGDKYYGKTKQGAYMTEADAKAKGFHADHGKACQ